MIYNFEWQDDWRETAVFIYNLPVALKNTVTYLIEPEMWLLYFAGNLAILDVQAGRPRTPGSTVGPNTHEGGYYLVLPGASLFGAIRGSVDGLAVFRAISGPRPSADGPGHPWITHLMQNSLPCIVKTAS